MGLQINGTNDTISAADGSLSISGTTNASALQVNSQNLPSAGPLSNRNLIINGAMQVAQRATSVTGITNTNGYRTVDRWRMAMENDTAAFTITQDTDVPAGQGFAKSTKIQCTTAETSSDAGDRLIMWQGIEGFNIQPWIKGTNATQVTLSFWVKTNLTGDFSIEFNDTDNNRHTCFRYTIAAAGTWQKVTWTVPADSVGSAFNNDNGGSAYLNFYFGAGTTYTSGSTFSGWQTLSSANRAAGLTLNLASSTSNYVNITGVQLEVGEVATPFEHRSYGDELARCQRYYLHIHKAGTTGYGDGASQTARSLTTITFPVQMRDGPTFSDANATVNRYRLSSTIGESATGLSAHYLSYTTTDAGSNYWHISSGYFTYTAEL